MTLGVRTPVRTCDPCVVGDARARVRLCSLGHAEATVRTSRAPQSAEAPPRLLQHALPPPVVAGRRREGWRPTGFSVVLRRGSLATSSRQPPARSCSGACAGGARTRRRRRLRRCSRGCILQRAVHRSMQILFLFRLCAAVVPHVFGCTVLQAEVRRLRPRVWLSAGRSLDVRRTPSSRPGRRTLSWTRLLCLRMIWSIGSRWS